MPWRRCCHCTTPPLEPTSKLGATHSWLPRSPKHRTRRVKRRQRWSAPWPRPGSAAPSAPSSALASPNSWVTITTYSARSTTPSRNTDLPDGGTPIDGRTWHSCASSVCCRSGVARRHARSAGSGVPPWRFQPRPLTPHWLVARANVALAEAAVRARQGDDHACIALARAALADAERAGDDRATALALERIHLGLVGLVADDIDRVGPRALEAHRRTGDHSGMARTSINLGVEAYYASRWSDAAQHYLDALDAAERAGSAVLSSGAALNTAEVLSDQGHWDQALELFDRALRNYRAIGYAVGIAAAHLFSAVASMRLGRLDEAAVTLDVARAEITGLGTGTHRRPRLAPPRAQRARTAGERRRLRTAHRPLRLRPSAAITGPALSGDRAARARGCRRSEDPARGRPRPG